MNVYKGLSLVFAASAAGMAVYAVNLEGRLLRAGEALNYTAKLIAKHDIPLDDFDVIAFKTILNK